MSVVQPIAKFAASVLVGAAVDQVFKKGRTIAAARKAAGEQGATETS